MDALYNLFLKEGEKNVKFNVFIIIVILGLVLNFYFKYDTASVIISVVFILWIANYYVKYEDKNVNDFNKITMSKLSSIQNEVDKYLIYRVNLLKKTGATDVDTKRMYERSKLTSLYMDTNLIIFLYSIKDLARWNNELYYKLVVGTNNILRILEEIEIYYEKNSFYQENIAEMLEGAMELRLKMVNNIHDFIYSIPKGNRTNKYLMEVSERYRVLITRVTDKIYWHYTNALKTRGINNMTKFINYFDSPKAIDPLDLNKFY